MTEEEAKTKWCPFARSFYWAGTEVNGQAVSVNRYVSEGDEGDGKPHAIPTTPHADCLCIGSACMAWRWEPDTKRGPGPLEEKKLPPGSARELGRRAGFVWVPGKREDEGVTWGLFPRIGFCGLAGKP